VQGNPECIKALTFSFHQPKWHSHAPMETKIRLHIWGDKHQNPFATISDNGGN
jgi:hypothetical protein